MLRFIKLTESGEADYYETPVDEYALRSIEPTRVVGVLVYTGNEDSRLDKYVGFIGVDVTSLMDTYNTEDMNIINLRGNEFISTIIDKGFCDYFIEYIINRSVEPRDRFYTDMDSELQRKGR